MKRLIFIASCLAILSCTSSKLILSESDRTAIQSNFDQQEDCWNKGDLDCYVTAYYPSGQVQTISRAGVTKGYDNILASYRQYYSKDKMGTLAFDKLTFKMLNQQYVYVVGRFNLSFEDAGQKRQGWFSVLMEKIDGNWYMVSDHSS